MSTTSSTSAGLNEGPDHSQSLATGVTQPAQSRHRSSSSISARSMVGASAGALGGSVTSIAPSRDSGPAQSRRSLDLPGGSLSREASVSSRRRSGANSPLLSSSFQQHSDHLSHHPTSGSQTHAHGHTHRPSLTSFPSNPPTTHANASIEHTRSGSLSSTTTSRYEEAAHHRAELETVKRENDSLRRRVRELEATLKNHRQLHSPGGGESSRSTTISRTPSQNTPNISTSASESQSTTGPASDSV